MTTANGYLRLALFKFPQSHRPSMLFDAETRNRLERIVNFVASVHDPMFLSVHLSHVLLMAQEIKHIFKEPSVIFQATRPNTGVRGHQKVLLMASHSMVETMLQRG